MVPSERTVTVAVGHGKRAARNIDAWLRGIALPAPRRRRRRGLRHAAPAGLQRRRPDAAARAAAGRPHRGFAEVVAGLTEPEARHEAQRCLSCGNCFECDNCYAACPEDAIVKLGPGKRYRVRLREMHRLRGLLRAMPVPRDRDGRGTGVDVRSERDRWTHAHRDHGRQHRRRACRLSGQRGLRDLSDHAVLDHGRTRRRMGGGRRHEHLGQRPGRAGDAERGRRRRRGARRAAIRRADDDLHGVAGPAADDAQHVQDRRRADRDGVPRRRARARDPGAVDLRRSFRRHGGAPDRLRAAVLRFGAGGARHGADRAGRDAGDRACRSCISSTGSAPRTRSTRSTLLERRADPRDDRRRSGARASRPRARPGASVRPRHRAEPRHVLPGARDGQSVLRAHARHRAGGDGPLRRADRTAVPSVRL